MNLNQYVHQVLIEENPYKAYKDCLDIRDRYITYDEVAALISDDLGNLDGATTTDHINYWLRTEFGSENLDYYRVDRVCSRIGQMVNSDEVLDSFYNG